MRAVGRLPRFGRPGKLVEQSSRGAQIWQLASGREGIHLRSPSKPAGSGCTLWAREVLHPNCLHASTRPGWVLAAMSEKFYVPPMWPLGFPPGHIVESWSEFPARSGWASDSWANS